MKIKGADFFDSLCGILTEKRGDMLYLTPKEAPYIRIGNALSRVESVVPINEKTTVGFVNLLINSSTVKVKKPFMEAHFNYESMETGKFKVQVSHGYNGYMLSISPVVDEVPEIESLGFPDRIKKLVHTQSGLILIIGKKNSGKSTTAASLVDFINKNYSKRIVVMEESLKYLHRDWLSTVKQPFIRISDILNLTSEFDKTVGDASVIAIDGFPMYETMSLSLMAARKGILVIAAVGTNGGVSEALRLMIECFPENDRKEARKTLAATLKAVLWQNLLPKKDGTGVLPVFEMLLNDAVISSLIYNERYHLLRPTMAAGSVRGMITITQALAEAAGKDILNKEAAKKFRDDTYSYYVNPVKEAYY
ncbi:hypothetical protein [Candidatus Magnetominusculus dajiuhuensis]|uniref:hypothetical protein n=1 Tax=Candidatus Magnetominusculus dajiuhuensis TaxID=3137712 RepID=UPI003B42C617